MKILKDKKIIVLVLVLIIFTIGYFIIANKISYAFTTDYDLTASYNNVIETIKECAKVYANNNSDLFNHEDIIYIKVQELIDNNLLVANEEGNISNPLDKSKSLNSNVIKIKKEDDKITVEVDS